jgi:hypothetical protein
MLPDIRSDDGITPGQPVKLAYDGLRFDLLRRAVEAQGLFALPAAQAFPPGSATREASLKLLCSARFHLRVESLERFAGVCRE